MIQSDYIILGAGASGLMLAYRIANDPFFDEKSIVIIDQFSDKKNDRTWCFWEEGAGDWDNLVHKTWNNIHFESDVYSDTSSLEAYNYKMIRSATFYKTLWDVISTKKNISFYQTLVAGINIKGDLVEVASDKTVFIASKVFNSLMLNNAYQKQTKYPLLQQHFLGWFVQTEAPVFDDTIATFMDFNIPQNGNTRFMYVLPLSKTQALFEYTLFSKDLLKKQEYEEAIKVYLKQKNGINYTITEKEYGSIPMTSYPFFKENTKHVLNIGTAGGWTKASTGYTFNNTTKKTKALIAFLKQENDLSKFEKRNKFWFYDLLFLDVLATENSYGSTLFSNLFKNVSIFTIFKFLDEESTFLQDLKIITAIPPLRFVKALFKRLF